MAETNAQLSEALAALEERLETPVVPGELPSWIDEACEALERVERHLRPQIEAMHPKQWQEMFEQDEGLASHIEHMQEQDQLLLQQLTEVRRIADALQTREDQLEPDELPAADATKALVEKGLQLVIAARTQETAIATWYVEAFDRDRGVVD